MGFVTYWVCRLKGCTYWVYRIMWVSLNSFELLQYEVCLIMEFCCGIKKNHVAITREVVPFCNAGDFTI